MIEHGQVYRLAGALHQGAQIGARFGHSSKCTHQHAEIEQHEAEPIAAGLGFFSRNSASTTDASR
jgi:hypothetical protein